jgi:hypothetical protein
MRTRHPWRRLGVWGAAWALAVAVAAPLGGVGAQPRGTLVLFHACQDPLAPQADTDADGLPDAVETDTGVYVGPHDTGTSPSTSDTDGDGVSDYLEVVAQRTDPTSSDTRAPLVAIARPVDRTTWVCLP